MCKPLYALMIAGTMLLSGCTKSDPQAAELVAARQDIADLKNRITALETRMQSLEAALPDDDRLPDPPANAASAPTS